MVSRRQTKKKLSREGFLEPELRMLELLEEILERFRWQQVLGYTVNYLLRHRLHVSQHEQDAVLKAAAQAVEQDGTLAEWRDRLSRIKEDLLASRRRVRKAVRGGRGAAGRGKAEGGDGRK